ncbi:hypothetical protein CCO03_04750 [Comamonas serinivorans]|uniref:Uncharacterized protein n=1 Tax=Comamonas serinivorans TaxID=1082851 RepID=A0A1Y0EKA4_9BURK|nr:hypothetical protein CCO03_04750 [Comamonas serinivorans]
MARALAKVNAWRQALAGMASGELQVGSRTPLRNVAAWLTPNVLHGGFASGQLMAGGRAQAHETHWLAQLAAGQPLGSTPTDCARMATLAAQPVDRSTLPQKLDRTPLNDWFLTEAGLQQLMQWLDDGRWRIAVPEEGALLVVAWLLRQGHDTSAARLLDTLSPYWHRVRFYPQPAATPMPALDRVSLRSAQDVMAQLNQLQTPPAVLAQHQAIHVWRPLLDELVLLWLQAVPGALHGPDAAAAHGESGRGADGAVTDALPRLRAGTREAEGGLPLAEPDADWRQQAAAWRLRAREAEAQHTRSRAHRKPGSHVAQLWAMLDQVLQGQALSEAQRRRLRFVLACQVSAHGVPGDARHHTWRAAQRAQTDTVWRAHWAYALAARVQAQGPYALGDGLPDLDTALQAATAQEAQQHAHLPEGTVVWPSLRRKLRRAHLATVPQLVQAGIVPSSEVLASVLPGTTGAQLARTMPDAASARLLGALWRAFRGRRSVLLLNHESQVRFHELPWVLRLQQHACVPATAAGTEGDSAHRWDMAGLARSQALAQLDAAARLALTQFPQSAFPNPLLWELRALAEQGGWQPPWVEDIAADIFMGSFGPKFGQAVHDALPWLQGSLYAQHFQLDLEALRLAMAPAVACHAAFQRYAETPAGSPGNPAAKREQQALLQRYHAAPDLLVAHLRARTGWSADARGVGANGAVIEQMGLVSTANFAPLAQRFGWGVAGAGLRDATAQARELQGWAQAARTGFERLCAGLDLGVREAGAMLDKPPTQIQATNPADAHAAATEAQAADRLLAERVRRAATSWRQVVLLLSLLPAEQQRANLLGMQRHLAACDTPASRGVTRALAPQLADLMACVQGQARDAGRPPFHGWTQPGQRGVLFTLRQGLKAG